MSNNRSRRIRKLMAETGMNYTRAARELEQREAAVDADTRMSTSAALPDVNRASGYLATVQEAADRFASAALPDMDRFATAALPDMDRFATAALPDMDRFGTAALPDMDRFGTAALPDMDRFGTAILPDMDRFATAILPDMDRFASITLPDVNLSSGYLAAVQEAVDQAAAFKIRFAPPV